MRGLQKWDSVKDAEVVGVENNISHYKSCMKCPGKIDGVIGICLKCAMKQHSARVSLTYYIDLRWGKQYFMTAFKTDI